MNRFEYKTATEEQKDLMRAFRDKFEQLAQDIENISNSREISLALTKLEEASFWLNKGIVKDNE